jgi:hypothetical protein
MMKTTIKAGSAEHKALFCKQFMDTYQDYDPNTLPWPALSDADLERLRAVPFWQEVYHTERRAGAIVDAFTPHVEDSVVREAIALQGFEERRHADLIRVMIERYGIDATAQPLETLPADLETAFIDFGFGECLDSFLGFGAFKTARQSEFLPDALFDIFDMLMFEETRHIVFFINYMAWREKQRGLGPVRRAMKSLRFYGRAGGRLMGMVKRGQESNDGKDFDVTQTSMFLEGFSFQRFVEDCYRENSRRMSVFDPELMQPRLLPSIAGLALRGMKAWDTARSPFRKAKAVDQEAA